MTREVKCGRTAAGLRPGQELLNARAVGRPIRPSHTSPMLEVKFYCNIYDHEASKRQIEATLDAQYKLIAAKMWTVSDLVRVSSFCESLRLILDCSSLRACEV